MKLYCSRTELNKALSNVSYSIPARTTSKILEGIFVSVNNGVMKLTSTDTNITIESWIEVQSRDNFEFVVPAKLFSAIVNKLSEEDMIIDYDERKVKVNITCGGSNSEIMCLNSDEYPRVKLSDEENIIYLSKEDVKKLIRKTAFSAATEDFNGILTGVLLEIKDGYMKMVGVDPYRISTYRIEVSNSEDISVIIPAKLINKAAKIISDEGEDKMSLEIRNNKVIMQFDSSKVTINTFNGKFIDYERIMNKECNISVRVKRTDLMRSTERASLLSSAQNNNLIRFSIEDDIIFMNSLNEEGNIEEKVEVIKEGDDLIIGMNSKYLRDALSVIDDEEIMMLFKDSVSPCFLKPLKGENYNYMILPIRLN